MTTSPSLSESPNLTLISVTLPLALDGMSIDALSLSTLTNESSTLILSPTLTKISMTSTSVAPPRSGTLISIVFAIINSPKPTCDECLQVTLQYDV